jgi:hypothetical protein
MKIGRPSVHRPSPEDPRLRANVALRGLSLLHFHALDFADWLEKWERRRSGQVRIQGQQAARLGEVFQSAVKNGDTESARRLYREWYVPGELKLRNAEAAGIVTRRTALGDSRIQ